MATDKRSMIDLDPVVISYDSLHLYSLNDLVDEFNRLVAALAKNPGDADARMKLRKIDAEIEKFDPDYKDGAAK